MASDIATMPEQRTLMRTPDQILGPFYPVSQEPDTSGDLTHGGRAAGPVLYVTGRVLTEAGTPIAGAMVEVWQANAKGRYAHPHDTNPAPLDPNFTGFATLKTDTEGKYRLKTIRPEAYPTGPGRMRPPHLHFAVTAPTERLVTQMYFAGEPWNEKDAYLQSARRKEALLVEPRPPAEGMEPGAQHVEFDIVLARG